jgi:thiol-disulfide isomerase/thioredoxin
MVSTRLEATSPEEFNPAAGRMQLVEFFAAWSPLSKSMAPVINALKEKYGESIGFVFLDIDDPANGIYKHLLDKRLPPVFLLLDGAGNVQQEWQGYVAVSEFENAFAVSTPDAP